jgi:hypothetical protein
MELLHQSITLIQSYLTGRYQCVVINSKISIHDIYSKWGINSKDASQESIVGPLFLIYINDLPITPNNSTPTLFANDTSVLIATSNLIDLEKKHVTT